MMKYWLLPAFLSIFCLPWVSAEEPKKQKMTILIRMMEMQDQWFRNELIPQAEKELGLDIQVVAFDKLTDIEKMVSRELKSGKKTIGLVKTEYTVVDSLVSKDLLTPLEEIVEKKELQKAKSEYLEQAISFAEKNGKTYYIPRKLETNLFLYRKSKVAAAVKDFPKFKDQIQQMFKEQNGYGLPKDFKLEEDPNQWDWYDLAAVAYIWAQTKQEDKYKLPRLAHRGKDYSGTTVELITKLYQLGATNDSFYQMQDRFSQEVFLWESFYVKNNLYNSSMWKQRWSGGDIWTAMSQGLVYAMFGTQIDAFFIHGEEGSKMPGYLSDPNDLGVAVMAKGASLAIDSKTGKPEIEGSHASQLSGWWWGIPKTSPNAELSYKLARFITSKKMHMEEASRFGMMPVTKEVYTDLEKNDMDPWKKNVFKMSQKQLEMGTTRPPVHDDYEQYASIWRKAWYSVVTQKNNKSKIDLDSTEKELKKYAKMIDTE